MKALLITNDFPPNNPGGMTQYYLGLASSYPAEELHVLTVDVEGADDRQYTFPVHRLDVGEHELKRFYKLPTMYRAAKRIVLDNEIDIVLCGNFRPFSYVSFWLRQRIGIPYVLFFHGYDLLRVETKMHRNPLKHLFYRQILSSAAGVVANSSYTARLIKERLGVCTKPVLTCRPGVPRDLENRSVAEPFPKPGNACRLLTVGRLTPPKGQDVVIPAIAHLRNAIDNLRYTVVGSGDQGPYRELAERFDVSDFVNFEGFVDRVQLHQLYRTHDILVLVSRRIRRTDDVEGFGIVYLEAGAFGKPVIGADSGGIDDAVEDGVTGLLVRNPTDPKEVAHKIRQLYDQPNRARQMGRRGHQRVNRDFTWDRSCEKLRHWLNSILRAGTPRIAS